MCPPRPLKRSRQRSEGNAQKRDEELEFSKESPLKTLHPVRSEIQNQKRRGGEGGRDDQSSQESAYSESPKPQRRSRTNTVYSDLSLSQVHPTTEQTLEEAPPKWALSDRSESSREVRPRELERREASGDQVSCLSELESMVEAPVPRNSHTTTLDGEGDRHTTSDRGAHCVDDDRGIPLDARKWPGDREGSSIDNYKNQFKDASSLVDPRLDDEDKVTVDYQDLRFDDDRSPAAVRPLSDRESHKIPHPSIINKTDTRTGGYAVVSEFGDTSQFDDTSTIAREKHGQQQQHSAADERGHNNQASSSEEDEDECMPPIYADNGRSSMGTAYGEQTFTHDHDDLLGRKERKEEENDRPSSFSPAAMPRPRLSTPPRKSTTLSEGDDTVIISYADERSLLQEDIREDGQHDPIFHECVEEENDKEEDDACGRPLGIDDEHMEEVPPGADMVREPQSGDGRRNGAAAREYVVSDIVSDVGGANRLFDDDLSTIKSDDLGARVLVQGREVEQEDSLTEQSMGASDAHALLPHDAPSSQGDADDKRVPPFYDDHEQTCTGLPGLLGDDHFFPLGSRPRFSSPAPLPRFSTSPLPQGGRPRFSPPAPLPRFSTSPLSMGSNQASLTCDMEGEEEEHSKIHGGGNDASPSPVLKETPIVDDGRDKKNEAKEDNDVVITPHNSRSKDPAPTSARAPSDTNVLVGDSLENLRQAAHGLPDAHSCASERERGWDEKAHMSEMCNQSESVGGGAEKKLEEDQGSCFLEPQVEDSRRTDCRGSRARTFSHPSSEDDSDGRAHRSNNEGTPPKSKNRGGLPREKRAPTRRGELNAAPRCGSPIRPRSLSYSPTSKGDRANISMPYSDGRIPRGQDAHGRHESKEGEESRCANSETGGVPTHEPRSAQKTDDAQRCAPSSMSDDGTPKGEHDDDGTPLVSGACGSGAHRRRSGHTARDEKDENPAGIVDESQERFFCRRGNGPPVFSPPRTPRLSSCSRGGGSLFLGENDNYKFAVNPFENSPKSVSPPEWAPRPCHTPAQGFTMEKKQHQIDDYEIAEDDDAESDSASWPSVNPNVKPLWRHDDGFYSSDDEQLAPEKTPPRSTPKNIDAYLKSEGRFEGWSNAMERLPKLPDVYQRSPSEESNIEEHTFPVETDPIQLDMDTPHTCPLEEEMKSPTSQSSSISQPESNTARLTYLFDKQESSVLLSPRPPSIGSSTRREKKSRERVGGKKCTIDMTPSPQSLMSGPPAPNRNERVRVAASPHKGRRSIGDSPQGKHGRPNRPNGKRPRMSRVSRTSSSASHMCPPSPSTSSPVPKCSRLSKNDDHLLVRECEPKASMEDARRRAQEEAQDFFRAFGVEFGANIAKTSFPGSLCENRNYDISRAAAAEWDSKQLMILDGLSRLPRTCPRSQHMEKSLITQYHEARGSEEEKEIIEEARYRIKESQDQAETDFLAKCEIQKKNPRAKIKQWKFLFDRKKALQSEGKMLEAYFAEMNGQATMASGSDFHLKDFVGAQSVDQFCDTQTEIFYEYLRNAIKDYQQRYTEVEASLQRARRRNVGKNYLRGIIPWYRVDDHLVCNFSDVSIPSRRCMETDDGSPDRAWNTNNNTSEEHLLYSYPPRFVPKLFCRHTELFQLAFETAFDECLRQGGHIPAKMGYLICELEAFYLQIRQFEIAEKNARIEGHGGPQMHVEASVIFLKHGDCLMIHFSVGDQQLVGPDGFLLITDHQAILARTLFSLQWPVHMWASGPRELEWFKYPSRIHVIENPDIDPAQYEKFTHAIRTKVEEYGQIYDIGSVIVDIKKVAIKARNEFLL